MAIFMTLHGSAFSILEMFSSKSFSEKKHSPPELEISLKKECTNYSHSAFFATDMPFFTLAMINDMMLSI